MKEDQEWTNVRVRNRLKWEILKIIQNENSRYGTISEFVQEAIRLRLEEIERKKGK